MARVGPQGHKKKIPYVMYNEFLSSNILYSSILYSFNRGILTKNYVTF